MLDPSPPLAHGDGVGFSRAETKKRARASPLSPPPVRLLLSSDSEEEARERLVKEDARTRREEAEIVSSSEP